MSGYSGTPLAQKLGIKPKFRVKVLNPPVEYAQLVRPIPDDVTVSPRLRRDIDMVHIFTRSRRELERILPTAMAQIQPAGMIWISWPKKSSGVSGSVTEDGIRQIALPLGLVDIKVCAVDEIWSGLKLVIRKELRPR